MLYYTAPRFKRLPILLISLVLFFPLLTNSSPAPNASSETSSVSASTGSAPPVQATGPGAILPNTDEFMLNKTLESEEASNKHNNLTDRPPPRWIEKKNSKPNVKPNKSSNNIPGSVPTKTFLPVSITTTHPPSTLSPSSLPKAFTVGGNDPDISLPTAAAGNELLPRSLEPDWSANNSTLESVMLSRRGGCPCPSSQRTCAYSNPGANQCYCCDWNTVCSWGGANAHTCYPSRDNYCAYGGDMCAFDQKCCSKPNGARGCIPSEGSCCSNNNVDDAVIYFCHSGQCIGDSPGSYQCLGWDQKICPRGQQCNNSENCCGSSCQPSGHTCCPGETHTCAPGYKCCRDGCIPEDQDCCNGGGICLAGTYCHDTGNGDVCIPNSMFWCDAQKHACSWGEWCCGSGCGKSGQQCCPSETHVCEGDKQCCGSTLCCEQDQTCCQVQGEDRCYLTSGKSICCGTGACWAGQKCCNGKCIEGDQICCDNGVGCDNGSQCCGAGCCPNGQQCSDGQCMPVGTTKCDDGHLCADGKWCCGGYCGGPGDNGETCCWSNSRQALFKCGAGNKCCGDGCCPNDHTCTEDGRCLAPGETVCDDGHTCTDGKWCCGSTCGGPGDNGDACCWNSNTQSLFMCSSGSQCCGTSCCPLNQQCSNGQCLPLGTQRCDAGQLCEDNKWCCGNTCGGPGDNGDTCCWSENNQALFKCGAGEKCCGDSCCPSDRQCDNGVCLAAGTQRCEARQLCADYKWCCGNTCGGNGETCCWSDNNQALFKCASGEKCCGDSCCPNDRQCDNGVCMPEGATKCDDGHTCTGGKWCCGSECGGPGDNGDTCNWSEQLQQLVLCTADSKFCGTSCCPNSQQCIDGQCLDSGTTVCEAGHLCHNGEECCGSGCRAAGTICCPAQNENEVDVICDGNKRCCPGYPGVCCDERSQEEILAAMAEINQLAQQIQDLFDQLMAHLRTLNPGMDLKKVKRQDDGWNWDDEAIELLERVRDSMEALEERIEAQEAIIDYAKVSGLMSTADSNLWDDIVTRIGPLITDFGIVMANPRVASAITILRNTVLAYAGWKFAFADFFGWLFQERPVVTNPGTQTEAPQTPTPTETTTTSTTTSECALCDWVTQTPSWTDLDYESLYAGALRVRDSAGEHLSSIEKRAFSGRVYRNDNYKGKRGVIVQALCPDKFFEWHAAKYPAVLSNGAIGQAEDEDDDVQTVGVPDNAPGAASAEDIEGIGGWPNQKFIHARFQWNWAGPNYNCYGLERSGTKAVGVAYHTEHVFELHLLKSFFAYFGSANCNYLYGIFKEETVIIDNVERDGTYAQELMRQFATYDQSIPAAQNPNADRLSEFFVLESRLNLLKHRILNTLPLNANSKSSLKAAENFSSFGEMHVYLRMVGLTVNYLQLPEVIRAWKRTGIRIREYMKNYIDPRFPEDDLVFEDVWLEWMDVYLTEKQANLLSWREEMVNNMRNRFWATMSQCQRDMMNNAIDETTNGWLTAPQFSFADAFKVQKDDPFPA